MDARLVDVVRAPPRRRGGAGAAARRAAGCSSRPPATPRPRRAPAAGRLIADAGGLDSAVVTGATGAGAVADPRGRRRARRPHPGGRAGLARLGGRRVPPERLGAYLREFDGADGATTAWTALPYGHFGDGCVHVRIDFPLVDRGRGRFREFVIDAAAAGRPARRLDVGRARRRPGARRAAAAACTRPARSTLFGRGQGVFDPREPAQPRGARRPGAGRRRPAGAAAQPLRGRPRVRLPARRRRPVDGGAPLRRRRQVPGRHHRRRRRDVPVLPGHPRREGLHPRPGPGAAGDGERHAGRRAARSPEVPRRSTCACPARAARATARPASTWPRTSPRCCTSATGAGCARARTTRSAGCRAGPRLAAARARGWPTRTLRAPGAGRRWPSGWAASTPAARCRRSPTQTFRALVRRAVARDRSAGDRRCCCGSTPSPTTSRPRSARPRCGCSRPPATRCRSPTEPVCCGLTWITTGQLDGARRQLRRSARRAGPALAERGTPIVGLEPSCTAVLRRDVAELLPDDPRAARCAPAHPHPGRAAGRDAGWTPPDLDDVAAVAQPHCHHHAVHGLAGRRRAAGRRGRRASTAVGGCCGLAGNFGVERGHYEVSVAVAETALLPAVRAAGPTPSCWPTASPAAPSSTRP